MIVLLAIVISISNLVWFYLGVKLVLKIEKKEEIEIPNLVKDFKEQVKEKKQKEKFDKEYEKYQTIYENIENYDGTSANQKDVPL